MKNLAALLLLALVSMGVLGLGAELVGRDPAMPPAQAATIGPDVTCFPLARIKDILGSNYKERLVAFGIDGDQSQPGLGLIQIYASPEGSWTLVVVKPGQRLGCLAGGGDGFRLLGWDRSA